MAPQDSVGRIHKQALVGSTSALFGVTLIAIIARFIIRLIVQKHLAIDDAVLTLGLLALITAFVILQTEVLDRMYMTVALQERVPGVIPPASMAEIMQLGYDFHKWVTVTLMLSWCSIMAAKFSILAFFWKLIDRIHGMRVYWWAVFILNLGVWGYGLSVYYVSCPYFNDPRSFQCTSGDGRQLLLTHSSAQTGFDLLGDIMILIIPINIIWKIRVRFAQKVVLFLSLGLTVIMIAITIIRVSGMVQNGLVDTTWEVYWLFLGGEVGILIASSIAFRSFFVSRMHSKNSTPPGNGGRFFASSFARKFRRRGLSELDSVEEQGLPKIPGAQLTGMRTFIDREGRTTLDQSQHTKDMWDPSGGEDGIPLRP